MAAARAVDTVKGADAGGRVLATLERSQPVGGADAAGVRRAALARALARPATSSAPTTTPRLVEDAGGDVRIVEAPRQNLKVTSPTDLRIAELLLADRAQRRRA